MLGSLCCCCRSIYIYLVIEEYSSLHESYLFIESLLIFDNYKLVYSAPPYFDGSFGYFIRNPDRSTCPIIEHVLIPTELNGRAGRRISMLPFVFNTFEEFKNEFMKMADSMPTVVPYSANGTHYSDFEFCLSSADIWSLYEDFFNNIISGVLCA